MRTPTSLALTLAPALAGALLLLPTQAPAAPVITEFMAANDSSLTDEDGDFSDWIEIHNPDPQPASLAGFRLTDNPAQRGWALPAITLQPGAYFVVFASGKNRAATSSPLHTDFQLAAAGEFLALIAPDGSTTSAFSPAFPPLLEDESFGVADPGPSAFLAYFNTPTPGAPNNAGVRAGPLLQPVNPHPPQPAPGPLTVELAVTPLNDPVASVRLFYRRMFAAETIRTMTDDGTGADRHAGDGIWTATIPADAFAPGEMTRWRFTAIDTRGVESQEPTYREPLDADRYLGTVARDPRIESRLPVLHWFTPNPNSAGTSTGSRGAVYYDGELYDNVHFNLHGQSSAGFPKKSYNIDFNRTHRFRWHPDAPRVADIDLLTNWADKSKTRHVLAYEVMRESGVAAHFAFTVRVQQNGAFFSTADLVEDADEIYLERAGLNPQGALYKMYANLLNKDAGNTGTTGVEKKTRRHENNADLQALIDGLDLTGAALERYLFDHIDIPACVNMLAANSVIRNIDMHQKNWYAYRDTGRSGEWALLPWDLDLSHGRVWNTQYTYFDNGLYSDGFVVNSTSIRLVAQLFSNPRTRPMLLRRIRTLHDRFLNPPPPPGLPESSLFYERRLNELSALIDPPDITPSDARRDFEKWGSWLQGGAVVSHTHSSPAVESMAEAVARWKSEYLPARRRFIYETQIVGRGGEIPLPQDSTPAATNFSPLVVQGAPARALVPSHGGLGLTWTGLPDLEPFPTTGWTAGTTGVGYERASGYGPLIGIDVNNAMRNNNSVFVRLEFQVADPSAFDRLELRMKFDDGFAAFLNGVPIASANTPTPLAWNSAAPASREANPSAFTAFDVSQALPHLRQGRNILAIQGLNDSTSSSDMLVVPELHGGRFVPPSSRQPTLQFGAFDISPSSGNQDQEFIELINPSTIAVDVSGWRIAGGIRHTLAPGTVIPPGGTLFLCPDPAAFRSRSTPPTGGQGHFIQGGYQGHLSNSGETLVLLDASGTTNTAITLPTQLSDNQRFLVISEIMYHPPGDGLAEFVELLNTSPTTPLNLHGVRFTAGVQFDFSSSAFTNLPPLARTLVVRNTNAFTATYGTNLPVAGAFANDSALSNGGERLKLEDADNATILEFTYDDQPPWPADTENGYSLVLIAPETQPNPALPANWRASSRPGGSPGGSDTVPYPTNPLGDANANGQPDLLDYALGNDLGLPPIPITVTLHPGPAGNPPSLRFSHTVSPGAERTSLTVHASLDLASWQDASTQLALVSRQPLGDGRILVTWQILPPLRNAPAIFLRLSASLP